jgi:hypothetical protein
VRRRPVERMMRDAINHQIYEGIDQVGASSWPDGSSKD